MDLNLNNMALLGQPLWPQAMIDPTPPPRPKMVTRTKKIFVGGLASASTVEDLKNYFSKYGKVEEAMLMFDKTTQRHRGFGFVTFELEDVVEEVCNIHYHEINGKMAECKRAQPKEVMLSASSLGRGRGITRGAYASALSGFFPAAFPAAAYPHGYGRGFHAAGLSYYYPGIGSSFGPTPGLARSTSRGRASTRPFAGLTQGTLGFPGYSYLPATPTAADRHVSPAAFFAADYGSAGTALAAIPRSEPSPLPISTSPLHRDFTQRTTAAAVLNNYQGFAPATSPATTSRVFPQPNSPGPVDLYNTTADGLGYIQAASPQPSGFANLGPGLGSSYLGRPF